MSRLHVQLNTRPRAVIERDLCHEQAQTKRLT